MFLKKYNLKNKYALVTGAGKGLGKACALALAEAGSNLIIISRTKKDLNNVSQIIKKYKVKCKSYVCDITDYNKIKSIINSQSRIDILVNNAGTNIPEHFTKVKKKNMEYMVNLNINAVFNVAQLAFFTSTVQINDRVEVWIHRRDQGQIVKLPVGAKIEIGTVKGRIHAVNQRYLTIITEEQELLEIKAGKALSTAVNVTAQAEALLSP